MLFIKKPYTYALFLLCALWSGGVFLLRAESQDSFAPHMPGTEILTGTTQDYLDKQGKYLYGAKLEYVVFPSQQAHDSDKILHRHGILYLKPDARGTILVCHGFSCDKFDIAFIRRVLFAQYNVMLFDFRAHGVNVAHDDCCTFGKDEALDVMGAVSYIKQRADIQNLPLIGYGFSMGAVAAIQAQATDSSLFDALVLDCPYDKSENVIKRSLEHLNFTVFGYTFEMPGKQLLEKFAFNTYVQSVLKFLLKIVARLDATATRTFMYPLSPVDSIKKIDIPCFFIHCKHDEKVPVQAAKALYANAGGYKRLWLTDGRRHFDSIFYNPEKYIYKVNKFIDHVLNQELAQRVQSKVYIDNRNKRRRYEAYL
ncbi:MAG: alpha/beta hydrolase [Candidatus Babeliales bacterium]